MIAEFGLSLLLLASVQGLHDANYDIHNNSALQQDPTLIHTSDGLVQGVIVNGTGVWRGIPYAAPPVGDRRWRPPQPHQPWGTDTPLDATLFGACCMQLSYKAKDGSTHGGWKSLNLSHMDEDCLFVNIYSPLFAAEGGGLLPVMVYFHAGEFWAGSGNDAENNFPYASIAERAVLVTINWRLGPWGYLASDDLRSRSNDNSTGNYGQQDQRAALRWLRKNIGAFGGNSSNVLIFGESSGGTAVGAHLANPRSWGLFDKAILESPGLTQVKRFDEAEVNHDYLLNQLAAIGSPGCMFRNRSSTSRTADSSSGVVTAYEQLEELVGVNHADDHGADHDGHDYTRYDGVMLEGTAFASWTNSSTVNGTTGTIHSSTSTSNTSTSNTGVTACADAAALVAVQAQAYCDHAFAAAIQKGRADGSTDPLSSNPSNTTSTKCTSFMLSCKVKEQPSLQAREQPQQPQQIIVEVKFYAPTVHISNRGFFPCSGGEGGCPLRPAAFVATAVRGTAGTNNSHCPHTLPSHTALTHCSHTLGFPLKVPSACSNPTLQYCTILWPKDLPSPPTSPSMPGGPRWTGWT
jgi:hypothetical protein